MKKRGIEKALAAFNLRDLQSFKMILIVLDQNDLTLQQALKYIQFKSFPTHITYVVKCPECKNPMVLHSVNTVPCDQVGGKWRSQWHCQFCGYESFSRKTVPQELHKMKKRNLAYKGDASDLEAEVNLFLQSRLIMSTCPECGKVIALHAINTEQGPRNVHGYRSVWFCLNEECLYEKYNKANVIEEATRLRRI